MKQGNSVSMLRVRAYRARRFLYKRWRILVRLVYGLPAVRLVDLVRSPVELLPLILEDACMPPHRGTAAHDDLGAVLRIARSLQPKVVVELGTAYGNLTANICRQCPGTKVYTVNAPVENQTGEMVTYRLTKEDIGRVYRRHGYSERVVQIFENTLNLDLSHYFETPVVGLAIIDACHDTDYVINDFRKVEPFVQRSGMILLHDTHPSMERHLGGSYMACMKLRRCGFGTKHLAGTWWGVWIKP